MSWEQDRSKSFVNPYNFISVYGKCKKDNNIKEIVKDRELISGVIDCTLITKTSIFIPNTTNKNALNIECEDKEHKSYDFFSYEDLNKISYKDVKEPVIPGSSIRGTIRAIYEALTNSCFSVIDDKRILSKRMPDASKPGIIKKENDKYVLYDSEKFMAKYKECKNDPNKQFSKKDYSNGQKVLFKPGSKYIKKTKKGKYIVIGTVVEDIIPYDTEKQHELKDYENFKEGYVLLGGEVWNKHHFSIISAEVNSKKVVSRMDNLDNLKKVIAIYKDNIEKKNEELEKEFDDYERKISLLENGEIDAIPVFYKKVGNEDGFIYLSPSCITREVYYNTIEKILKDMGDYNPCDDISKLCDACSLFGMVGQEANASRIRFTDGRYKSNENGIYDDIVTLKELATPRISSTEFYMESPRKDLIIDAEIWTYDYAAKWSGNRKIKIKGFEPKLRGRKFYWHHREGLTMKNNKCNKMNVTIRPVKKGVKFEFKVFFERITKDELNKLVWVLNLGDNSGKSNYCHKMGMGKPLGLGSVKIVVNSVKQRIIDLDTLDNVYRYEDIETDLPKFNDDVLREVKIATNLNSVKGTISYPKAIDRKRKETIYNWFIANKCVNGGTGTKPKINKTLCKVTEKDLTLPYYKEVYKGRNKNK